MLGLTHHWQSIEDATNMNIAKELLHTLHKKKIDIQYQQR